MRTSVKGAILAKKRTKSVFKPITLKRIQRFHNNRNRMENINSNIEMLNNEEENNKNLTLRTEGLKMQIESVKNESMEIIKSHKETMAKVLNGSKPKDNACLDKGHWITADEMLIGWKPPTESYEGGTTSLLLMKHMVDRYKRKIKSKEIFAKKILELVENFQKS